MRMRLLVAGITAPLVGLAVLAAAMRLSLGLQNSSWHDALGQTTHAMFFLVFFGALPAYLLEIGIGVPAYRYLVRRQRLRPAALVGICAVAGAITFGLTWSSVFDSWSARSLLLSAGFGGLGGAAAALWFWLVAFSSGRQAA